MPLQAKGACQEVSIYSATMPEFGPLAEFVKCPKCGGKAGLSSHNHVVDIGGYSYPIWMPTGWRCANCNIIFCGLCKEDPLKAVQKVGDQLDFRKALDVEVMKK